VLWKLVASFCLFVSFCCQVTICNVFRLSAGHITHSWRRRLYGKNDEHNKKRLVSLPKLPATPLHRTGSRKLCACVAATSERHWEPAKTLLVSSHSQIPVAQFVLQISTSGKLPLRRMGILHFCYCAFQRRTRGTHAVLYLPSSFGFFCSKIESCRCVESPRYGVSGETNVNCYPDRTF
jgi:hypothetical protein